MSHEAFPVAFWGLKEMILLFTGRTSSFESSQPSCYFKLLMGMSQIFGYAHHSQPNGGPKKNSFANRETHHQLDGFFQGPVQKMRPSGRGGKKHIYQKRFETNKHQEKPTKYHHKHHRKPSKTSTKIIKTSKDRQQPSKTIKIITSGRHSLQEDHSAKVALATNCHLLQPWLSGISFVHEKLIYTNIYSIFF